MSTLLDAATYQALTGDTATPTDAQLAVAQKRVEAFLHRPVPQGTYTHRLRIHRDGVVYPPAQPISDAGAGATVDGPAVYVLGSDQFSYASAWLTAGFSLINASPYGGRPAYGTLTYTGGWTADTVPQAVLDGLAWETWRAVHPGEVPQPGGNSSIAVGATSLATGDVSVSYGGANGTSGGSGVALAPGGDVMAATAAAVFGYIHREVTAA